MIMGRVIGGRRFAWALLVAAALVRIQASAGEFVRGDVDGTCHLQALDAYWLIAYLFLGKSEEVECLDAADVDDSGKIDLSDAIYLFDHLYRGGPEPPAPFRDRGGDTTGPSLGCDRPTACGGHVEIAGIPLGRPNAVVFILERAEGWTGPALEIAKRELRSCVSTLSESTAFGIVAFASDLGLYPAPRSLAPAAPEEVRRALEFLDAVRHGHGCCPQQAFGAGFSALESALQIRWQVVYLGTGAGYCQGANEATYLGSVLASASRLNWAGTPVHTVAVGEVEGVRKEFLVELARRNGGMHAHVTE